MRYKNAKKDGLEVLQEAKEKGSPIPFIMLTGHGNIQTAVEAMKMGAMILFQTSRSKSIAYFSAKCA